MDSVICASDSFTFLVVLNHDEHKRILSASAEDRRTQGFRENYGSFLSKGPESQIPSPNVITGRLMPLEFHASILCGVVVFPGPKETDYTAEAGRGRTDRIGRGLAELCSKRHSQCPGAGATSQARLRW
jgi:hypothetical protein